MSFLKSLLDGNEREVARLRKTAAGINALEPRFEALSDEEMAARTEEFREALAPAVARLDEAKERRRAAKDPVEQAAADTEVKAAYASLEEELHGLLPEAFALVREASKRVLKMRHFDVQMMAGTVLHQGRVSELATGEGKTLSATSPLYLNALPGKGAHLVTPNDYLAKRDAVWNAPVFHMLGLTVGVIQSYPYGAAYVYEPGLEAEDPHLNELRPVHRRECYQCDIIYGTNAEFGFDYLRDNMAHSLEEMVQRDLHYAIVDEMDSILIDEARTPLIISGMPEQSTDLYYRVDRVVARLEKEKDYTVDEKAKNAMLTDDGIHKVELGLNVSNLAEDVKLMHHVNAALRARFAYRRDVDYVVSKENQVVIVDEFTGRLMHGRRYSDGLHQAIEAKEGVKIEEETQTVATITIQNYFRLYHKLAGMTGTAKTEESEIRKIYGMDVVVVPTNLPMIRADQADVVYKTEEQKFRALVAEILQKYIKGQPTLVGTRSIEISERLSERLLLGERLQLQALIMVLRDRLLTTKSVPKDQADEFHGLLNSKLDTLHIPKLTPVAKALNVPLDALHADNVAALKRILQVEENEEKLVGALQDGIPHAVLNAKNHEREAEIIAEAGRKHAVTIATNMAGRGVDIMLGGKAGPEQVTTPTEVMLSSGIKKTYPSEESAEVAELGGLAILGSERHESRRIDRQLRGRSGRQGDPGESRFYLSLEDELWRLFGDRGRSLLAGWPEYEVLEARILTKAIERAQRKVEEHNFGIRKHTLEYDDVMNVHRDVIYRQRREILEGAELRQLILDHAYDMVQDAVDRHCSEIIPAEEWEVHALYDEMDLLFDLSLVARPAELESKNREELVEFLYGIAEKRYEQKEQELEQVDDPRNIERQITLQVIDQKWVEHLNSMEYLREGVWMRGFEQRDPLVVYKKEAFDMFNALLDSIQDDMVNWMFHLVVRQAAPPPPRRQLFTPVEDAEDEPVGGAHRGNGASKPPAGGQASRRVGRNDPCPCGSGKKYKFCHLKTGAYGEG
jgi:preprotein translocase subunit SecA